MKCFLKNNPLKFRLSKTTLGYEKCKYQFPRYDSKWQWARSNVALGNKGARNTRTSRDSVALCCSPSKASSQTPRRTRNDPESVLLPSLELSACLELLGAQQDSPTLGCSGHLLCCGMAMSRRRRRWVPSGVASSRWRPIGQVEANCGMWWLCHNRINPN